MTVFLLDVNVLIALIDPVHTQHDAAHNWFSDVGKEAWASCPITENAVLRIVGDRRYPNPPGTPAAVAGLLAEWMALPGHVFWQDDISLFDASKVHTARLLTSRQVTDSYLLALACTHRGKLATFDTHLIVDAVQGAGRGLHLIH
jgi:toxin-antitoxin system PIN domain toxin